LKDAMVVYGGSGRKRGKREYCETGSRRVAGVVCTRPILAAWRVFHDTPLIRQGWDRRVKEDIEE